MLMIDYQHLPLILKFFAGLAVALGVGWSLGKLRPRTERIDSLLILMAPPSLYVLGVKSAMAILLAPMADWSAGRLSPTYALLRGFSLYYPADSGPVYNTIYPPMSYLAHLPAALFHNPTWALMAGALIGQVLVLGPILALCSAPHGDEGSTRGRLFSTFVFFGFWKYLAAGVLSTLFCHIHADAPSIGFGAMACVVLYARRMAPTPSARTLLSSAIFASMAVWSKQAMAPLFVVLPAWMLLTAGPRAALRFSAWLGVSLAALSAIFVGAFGWQAMKFNIIDLPKSHPWMYAPDYKHGFATFLIELAGFAVPVVAGLVAVAYLARRRPEGTEADALPAGRWGATRADFRGNYWVLFAVLSAAFIPLGMLGRIKMGGHVNSYAHSLYFLGVAPCLVLLDWYARNRERGRDRLNRTLKVLVLAWPLAPLLMVNTELLQYMAMYRPASENSQEVAYQYALKHPGEAYFPWNTLSTLMAEGQAYHFEAGIFDRDLGGFALSDTHFRRHLPAKLKVVAYPPDRVIEWSMKYLPEFKRRVAIPELPGWICYER